LGLGDFGLELLNNAFTVNTLGTLGVGLNKLCLIKWPRAFGTRYEILWFEYEMFPPYRLVAWSFISSWWQCFER
jgi:hypothetical protein